MTKDEALRLALDALRSTSTLNAEQHLKKRAAVIAIKEALAAPTVQEPVKTRDTLFRQFMSDADKAGITHWPNPPAAQRQWVEVEQIKWEGDKMIAKLKEKNT